MPAAIAVPLISSAIAGGASVAAGAMGSHAAGKAAKTEAAAAKEALEWEKQQYRDQQARLQPYRDLGGQAYQRMGQMLGLTNGAPAAGGSFSFRPTPSASGGLVNIRNPRTGEVRAVPAAQAEILKTRGGQVVG